MKEHRALILACSFLVLVTLIPVHVRAHCDTLDGPVVATAKAALEKGDITPVLKWVKGDDEREIKEGFPKGACSPKGIS